MNVWILPRSWAAATWPGSKRPPGAGASVGSSNDRVYGASFGAPKQEFQVGASICEVGQISPPPFFATCANNFSVARMSNNVFKIFVRFPTYQFFNDLINDLILDLLFFLTFTFR